MDPKPEYDYTLTAKWSKKEKDLVFDSPCRPDGHLLYGWMSCVREAYFMDMIKNLEKGEPPLVAFHNAQAKTFIEELTARGYDITTLKFSVKRLKR